MKYEKEIRELKSEQSQVKVQLDKAVALRNQIGETVQRLVTDYNGLQKAIDKLTEMGGPEKEQKPE
jgi:uncharacterized coiled-coil DUF342 family protein